MKDEPTSYTRTAKAFHWTMALIIIVVWCLGFYSANLRDGAVRGGPVLYVHKAIATTVLFLFIARVGYRLTRRYPGMPAYISKPMGTLAAVMHVLLYLVAMCALPLTGWYWSSVAGHPSPVLGLFNLPPMMPKDLSMYDTGMWAHRVLAWTVGVLVALHVLAALKHHFLDKDDILRRMWPSRRRAGAAGTDGVKAAR